jgi:hypothetical protein
VTPRRGLPEPSTFRIMAARSTDWIMPAQPFGHVERFSA